MLHINDLSYRIEGRPLFEQATYALNEGTKAGLVGRNGTGKSTLFKLIEGDLSPDEGSISLRKNIRLGKVAQEVPSGPESLINVVLKADEERHALLLEEQTCDDPHRIAAIHIRLADIEAYSAEARAARILAGLGFPHEDQLRPCSDFSGGWRMRVALAAVLFSRPDLLLLDEPTNYLDAEGALWLENYLRTYPGTALIISHDRDFLNNAVGEIVHLREGKLFAYSGGYDEFERKLAEQQSQSMAFKAKQEDERRRLQAFVDRFRAKASKAKQAQSRLKRLEKMEPVSTIIDQPVAPLSFEAPERALSPPIVRFDETKLGYGDLTVLRNVNLSIDTFDRIGLLGRNGEGKSTMAKAILGEITPQDGRIKTHKKLQIGYFSQHQIDQLNPEHSAYDHIVNLMPDATEAERRSRLATFGLGAEKAETPAKNLSGGEKARLLFSLIAFDPPHLLVLDEPVNHLDIDSRERLVQGLNDYEGAVVIISHDRYILEACTDRLWLADAGTVRPFDGSLDDYRQHCLAALRGERADQKRAPSGPSRQDIRREAAQKRAAIAPLKKAADQKEKHLEELTSKMALVDKSLAVPGLYEKDPERFKKLSILRGQLEKDIEAAELDWLEAAETYEAAQRDT